MNIYEIHGHHVEQSVNRIQELHQFFETTMQLLSEIKDGKTDPSRLILSTTGWEIGPVKSEPSNNDPNNHPE